MSRPHWVFAGVLSIAIAWTVWLSFMAATVADPLVVSAPQLHFASIVVAGKVTVEGANAKVVVIKTFKDDIQQVRQKPLPEVLTIPWLDTYPKAFDQQYLLPLIPNLAQGETANFQVAPVFKQDNNKPFQISVVYPLTDSVRIQAERILNGK